MACSACLKLLPVSLPSLVASATFHMHTPPSFNKFKAGYVTGFGFSEWLASMDGITPNENQWYSIISTYVREGGRKVNDIPVLVATLEKHNNIKIGPIYGIMTVEYWQDRLSNGQAQVA